jgi:hypothetical protein
MQVPACELTAEADRIYIGVLSVLPENWVGVEDLKIKAVVVQGKT